VLIAVGVCLVTLAVPCSVFIYSYAAMVDPSLADAEWKRKVAMKFFFSVTRVLGAFRCSLR
jgi:hypothetical protein